MRSVWLMYHDVHEGQPAADVPTSAAMYHLSRARFVEHVDALRSSGRRIVSVDDPFVADSVAITFDDGWRGAFEIALPVLAERGIRATYFITRDFVGRPHMADAAMIRGAASAGMQIGVHGTTHRMLSGLSADEIFQELASCRGYLEDLVGQPVLHASLPGGDLNRTIISAARRAGLRSLSTSRPGVNGPRTSAFRLRRMGVKHTTTADDVRRYCRFQVREEELRWLVLQAPRTMLGMKNYSRVRRWILDKSEQSEVFEP